MSGVAAKELYETDPGFRGFLACWDEDRRCPLELVDYLLDRGMGAQAECARWAAETPDRPVLSAYVSCGERPGICGPYPMMHNERNSNGFYGWWWGIGMGQYAGAVEPDLLELGSNYLQNSDRHDSAVAAMLTLMDSWKDPVPA